MKSSGSSGPLRRGELLVVSTTESGLGRRGEPALCSAESGDGRRGDLPAVERSETFDIMADGELIGLLVVEGERAELNGDLCGMASGRERLAAAAAESDPRVARKNERAFD